MTILDDIRARAEAATPGPWQWSPEENVWGDCGPNLETVERGPVYSDGSQGAEATVVGSWGHDANGISVEDSDKEFIAHAREDVPRLLHAVYAVLALHREVECVDEDGEPTGGTCCEECKDLDDHSGERVHEVFPCRTVREIQAALAGQETFTAMRDRIEGGK